MSDKSSDKNGEYQHTVILHPASSHNNEYTLKVYRILFFSVIALMLVVLIFGFFIWPKNSILTKFEKQQVIAEIQNQQINPALSEEINVLKSQLIGLISGSIESKLRILEESIQSGTLTTTGKGAIQDLKNDVIVLKTYSETGAGRLIAKNTEATSTSATKLDRQLMDEVSQLKNLLYISIASCGLMIAAIGGIWYQSRYRLIHDRSERKQLGKFR
jgi:hypothetical protein